MNLHYGTSARRKRRSGGSALVEWAFVLLPTLALITSFLDVSYALFGWSTLQNAVRIGCRYAITFQTSGALGQDASIEQVVSQSSMGLLPTGSPLIFVTYATQLNPNTPIPAPNGNTPGNIVTVSVQAYPLTWLVPISGSFVNPYRATSPATVSVYSADVLGGYPAGVNSVAR